ASARYGLKLPSPSRRASPALNRRTAVLLVKPNTRSGREARLGISDRPAMTSVRAIRGRLASADAPPPALGPGAGAAHAWMAKSPRSARRTTTFFIASLSKNLTAYTRRREPKYPRRLSTGASRTLGGNDG